jgi:hypothetical protein
MRKRDWTVAAILVVAGIIWLAVTPDLTATRFAPTVHAMTSMKAGTYQVRIDGVWVQEVILEPGLTVLVFEVDAPDGPHTVEVRMATEAPWESRGCQSRREGR